MTLVEEFAEFWSFTLPYSFGDPESDCMFTKISGRNIKLKC